jgi:hypothetical protein
MAARVVLEHLDDHAGNGLYELWKPDGLAVGAEGDAKLRSWLRKNAIDASPYAFIRGAAFAKERKRAVAHFEAEGKT